ncbi:MAG: ATP-dependent helicase [Acidobacteria bacterium]|nr:ATP-dependent helicase [Acidobacteriota bacterium]
MNNLNSTRWDDGLEGPAKRIAEIDRSPLRILAGPGTGKTFALMRRVARLLQNGANARRILVCTFTRTAAADLEKEIAKLGVEGVNDVWAGTLHAFCFGLLPRSEVLELTKRVPRPLLEFEERFLLEDIQGDDFGGIRERRRRLRAFNAAWARLQTDEPGWPVDPVDRAFHNKLLGWLRFHEAMLIGEIVPETLRFLRENPASNVRGTFEHVLVDEYQDLNRAEQVLLDLLAEAGTLTVVGDENQSIYTFKHAHPEGISTFEQTHPGTHDESLLECRRCPSLVVELANALISNNSTNTNRAVRPMPGNPRGEVYIVQWRSMEEEAEGIAQFIQQRIQFGQVEPGRVLVLAPRRQFGYAIRDALNNLDIPAHSFFHEEALEGNPKKIDECAAQQAFTRVTLLANPDDRVALRCWCGFGSNSLRSCAWARLRAYCEESGESPRAALERLASGEISLPHTRGLVTRLQELQQRLNDLTHVVGQALADSLFPVGEPWTEPLRILASSIGSDDFSAKKLREVLRVGITQPELPTDVDYVRVMSLHKSKGLTADLVVVVGCIEGLIPTVDEDLPLADQSRALEEQRRLFYVAITRTRKTFVLSSVTELPRELAHRIGVHVVGGNRTHARTMASTFLGELGPSRPPALVGSTILRNQTS